MQGSKAVIHAATEDEIIGSYMVKVYSQIGPTQAKRAATFRVNMFIEKCLRSPLAAISRPEDFKYEIEEAGESEQQYEQKRVGTNNFAVDRIISAPCNMDVKYEVQIQYKGKGSYDVYTPSMYPQIGDYLELISTSASNTWNARVKIGHTPVGGKTDWAWLRVRATATHTAAKQQIGEALSERFKFEYVVTLPAAAKCQVEFIKEDWQTASYEEIEVATEEDEFADDFGDDEFGDDFGDEWGDDFGDDFGGFDDFDGGFGEAEDAQSGTSGSWDGRRRLSAPTYEPKAVPLSAVKSLEGSPKLQFYPGESFTLPSFLAAPELCPEWEMVVTPALKGSADGVKLEESSGEVSLSVSGSASSGSYGMTVEVKAIGPEGEEVIKLFTLDVEVIAAEKKAVAPAPTTDTTTPTTTPTTTVVPETETPAGVDPVTEPNDFEEPGTTDPLDTELGVDEVIPDVATPEPVTESNALPEDPTTDGGY